VPTNLASKTPDKKKTRISLGTSLERNSLQSENSFLVFLSHEALSCYPPELWHSHSVAAKF